MRVTIRYLHINVDRFAQRQVKAEAHAWRIARAGLLDVHTARTWTRRLYLLDGGADLVGGGAYPRDGRTQLLKGGAEHMLDGVAYDADLVDGGTYDPPTGLGAALGARDWRDWLLDELVKLLPAWALQPEDLNTDGIDPNGDPYPHTSPSPSHPHPHPSPSPSPSPRRGLPCA